MSKEEEAKEIENPRRVLAVSLESASQHLSRVIKDLSGTQPEPSPTLSGVTHPLPLTTPYYTATLPLWLDLIEDPEDWAETFLSPEAKEVLEALGGLVIVFEVPKTSGGEGAKHDEQLLIEHVGRVVKDGLGGWGWDGVAIAIGLGADSDGLWEDLCADAGVELILMSGNEAEGARNEFGEKMGIARAIEALQANDWTALPPTDDDLLDDDEDTKKEGIDDDDDNSNFEFYGDKSDFEGLRQAILEASLEREGIDINNLTGTSAEGTGENAPYKKEATGDEKTGDEEEVGEEDVQKLERMMSKLRAVREMGEGMSEEERRRMARRAVDEVMREL